jgi:hypothetical protein
MCAKKILSFVACFYTIFSMNLFAGHEDSMGNKPPYGFSPWGNYGNSPWNNKIAEVEYKKKRIDAWLDLLTKVADIKKELSPELAPKEKRRDGYVEQGESLRKTIRILQEQRRELDEVDPAEGQRRAAKLDARIREKEAELYDLNRPDGDFARLNAEIDKTISDLKKNPDFTDLEQCRKDCLTKIMTALKEEEKKSDGFGLLIARALAGPNYSNAFDDIVIDNWYQGALQGGTFLLTGVLGEVVRKRAEKTINDSVGSVWDYFFDGLINFCGTVKNVLFHDTNEPFDSRKLEGWQKMISTAYFDISEMLQKGLRDGSRGLDSVSRQFDDSSGEVQIKKDIDMWATLAVGYAEQFAYFITIFEQRQAYYDEDDIKVFYSQQICQLLQATCKLLISSKSLKDLDSKLESQKMLINAMSKNINNLFIQLIDEVKPKQDQRGTSAASSPYKSSQYPGAGYGYGNADPMSYSGNGQW